MSQREPMKTIPQGIIDVPVTPFTPDNAIDLDTFARVIEFLLRHNASSLCINLHLAESLNLTLDERKLLANTAVEVTAGRVPVIVHVSTPGTDQAVDLARHAEKIGADCVIAIAPYYWKPSQEALYEHFCAIISATDLPFIAYSSPTIMDGIGISPETLVRLMERFPNLSVSKKQVTIGKNILNSAEQREAFAQISVCLSALNGLFHASHWAEPLACQSLAALRPTLCGPCMRQR